MGEKVLFLRGGDGELPWSFIFMHKDGNQSENKENLVKSSRLRFVLLPGPSAERQPFLQKRSGSPRRAHSCGRPASPADVPHSRPQRATSVGRITRPRRPGGGPAAVGRSLCQEGGW